MSADDPVYTPVNDNSTVQPYDGPSQPVPYDPENHSDNINLHNYGPSNMYGNDSTDPIAALLLKYMDPRTKTNNESLPNPTPQGSGDTIIQAAPAQSNVPRFPAEQAVIYISAIVGIVFAVHYFLKQRKEKKDAK
jgi:hypothetical protein